MAFVWNPLALVGVAAFVVGWTAGIAVYAAAPRRAQNRLLALVLILEGTGVGMARGLNALHDDPRVGAAFSAIAAMALIFDPLVYWLFYTRLPSRLAARLRWWPLTALLSAAAVAGALYFLTHLDQLARVYWVAFETWTAFGLLGLLVALSVVHDAPRGSQTRRQGVAYAIAFGLRDVAWFAYVWWLLPTYGGRETWGWSVFFAVFAPSITIVFVALLAHGILRTQLFDIDLRLKQGVGRSVALAFVAAAFFLVSQAAERLLEVRGWVPGIVAAGAVALVFLPLQRAAVRLLDHLVPSWRDTPTYRNRRKEEVYAAALEDLVRDGRLSDDDRARLASLRAKLGLPAAAQA